VAVQHAADAVAALAAVAAVVCPSMILAFSCLIYIQDGPFDFTSKRKGSRPRLERTAAHMVRPCYGADTAAELSRGRARIMEDTSNVVTEQLGLHPFFIFRIFDRGSIIQPSQ
jgi:hypothetical protein